MKTALFFLCAVPLVNAQSSSRSAAHSSSSVTFTQAAPPASAMQQPFRGHYTLPQTECSADYLIRGFDAQSIIQSQSYVQQNSGERVEAMPRVQELPGERIRSMPRVGEN